MARKPKPRTPVAERLVAVREHCGESRDQFAERVGWNASTLGNYEQGKNFPDPEFLTKLQDLGFSLDWVITGHGEMRLGGEAAPTPATPALDGKLMGRITDGIVSVYKAANAGLPPQFLGQRAAQVYAAVAVHADPDDRLIALGQALEQLRQELREARSAGSSKSSA